MIQAVGVTHRKNTAPITNGLTIRCSNNPMRNQTQFSGHNTRGNAADASAKAPAIASAHQRGDAQPSSGQQPMSAKTTAKTTPTERLLGAFTISCSAAGSMASSVLRVIAPDAEFFAALTISSYRRNAAA